MKKNVVLFLVVALLFGFAPAVNAKPTNEVLRIGTAQEFENLNPLIKQMVATSYAYDMVGRALMTLDADSKWVPSLALEIPTFENGKAQFITENEVKKIKAVWEIHPDAKWGDGKPVTGHDVKFSWEVGKNENVSVGERDIWSRVERIEIDPDNPKKMAIVYKEARWDYYQMPQFYILPKHLEEPVYIQYGKEKQGYEKNSLYSTDPGNPGLYCGPYTIEELKLGSHIILKPNPMWHGKKPAIKKIIITLIPNTATLEANLMSGSIDLIANPSLPFDQALAFEKRITQGKLPYTVVYKTGCIYEHIDLQLGNPFLSDVRVRKALVYGIDRKKLVDSIYEGKLTVAVHDLSPVDPWFVDSPDKIVLYKHSRKEANKLLEEAGWVMNKSDGYRYKDGERLSFQLMTTAGNKARELVQVYLQEQWKKIGVEITIKNEPARVFFGETVRKSLYPAMTMFAWWSSPDNNPRAMQHSESIPRETNGFAGQNSMRWVNKTVDELIEQIDKTFDANKRTELRHKILWQYTNEVPTIPLYYRTDISVIPKSLVGYRDTGHQFGASLNVESWSFN